MFDPKEGNSQAPFGNASQYQDNVHKKSNRRSTLLVRSQNQTEPPIENPANSDEVNTQLKHEYNSIHLLNKALSSVLHDFEQTSEEIRLFSQTLNNTDNLLSLWLSILERTEDTKSVLEDEKWNLPEKKNLSNKEISLKGDENLKKRRLKE